MKRNVSPVLKKLKIRGWRRGYTQWRYQTQMSGRCNREEKPIDVHWIVWIHSITDLEELENQKNKKKDTFHQEKKNFQLAKSSSSYHEHSQLLGHPVVKCERYNFWNYFHMRESYLLKIHILKFLVNIGHLLEFVRITM